jgi:Zn-dependent protease
MGRGSIQLARVFGIRVGVSPSWFFILFLMIYSLSGYFDSVLSGSRNTAYAIAVAGAILFFASIVLHELGHALVARREGIGISGIDLWFFGGIAKMEREAETPGEDFKVAAAGPAVTLLIAAVSLVGAIALSETGDFFDIARLNDISASPGLALLGWLFLINAVLFAFNLIPAFPLDGGRIARAIAWRITGDRNRATKLSGRIGQAFGYGLIGFGIFLGFAGDTIDGIWFALLGTLLGAPALAGMGAIAVVEPGGRLAGVVTMARVRQAIAAVASQRPL